MKKLRKFNQKGFTLIELLVVVAIIGLLSSVVLISLNTARSKARDAKRLADVRQISSALEIYMNDAGHYPIPATTPTVDQKASTVLNGTLTAGTPAGNVSFVSYMAKVPDAPTPADTPTSPLVDCKAAAGALVNNDYRYATTDAAGSSYTLKFCLGGTTGGYTGGTGQVTPSGLTQP